MKHSSALVFLFLFAGIVFAQTPAEDFISTQGTIVELEMKRAGRSRSAVAKVRYTIGDGQQLESYVNLVRIPLIGTFKSVGDVIDVSYDPNNPALVRTETIGWLQQYGIWILVALGAVFSLRNFAKARKRAQ